MKFQYPKKNQFNIDIAPLIDVVFQLIVFLLLSLGKAHFFLNIELPKLDKEGIESEFNIPVISIEYKSEKSIIYWNSIRILLKEIKEYIKKENPKKIILKSDKKVPYGEVISVLAEIQNFSSIELLLEYEME